VENNILIIRGERKFEKIDRPAATPNKPKQIKVNVDTPAMARSAGAR
jgi:hypothetical protein